MFVDLWGRDFSYDESKIYETKSVLRIIGNNLESEDIPPEFVGTKNRIRLQGYYNIRKQLADYIREKMYNEWVSFGKTPAIKKWYLGNINNNINRIEELIVEKYLQIQNGEKPLPYSWHSTNKNEIDIYYVEQKYPEGWNCDILNEVKDKYKSEFLCSKTGAACNIFFTFAPKNWSQLEFLCNCEVPKIVKG